MTIRERSAWATGVGVGIALLYLARVALPAAQSNYNGFAAYYTAAHILADTPSAMPRVYDDAWFRAQIPRAGIAGVNDIFNVQPPTMSLMLLPLVSLGPRAARFAWMVLSLLSLACGMTLLAMMLALPARWGLGMALVSLAFHPVTQIVRSGQAYLVLFFLLCVVFWGSVPRSAEKLPHPARPIAAGISLGIMLALKAAGVWLWPLLLLGGYRRVVGWAAGTVATVALCSLPWIGLETWQVYFARIPGFLTSPKHHVTAYQTVNSLFGHLFVLDARWNPGALVHAPLLARLLTVATILLSLGLSLRWAQGERGRPECGPGKDTLPVGTLHASPRNVLTLALFAALLPANGPVGAGHHSVLTLPSLVIACWWAWKARLGWRAWGVLVGAAFMIGAPLPYLSPRFAAGWMALFAYPRLYGAYVLWAWLAWALRDRCRGCREPPPLPVLLIVQPRHWRWGQERLTLSLRLNVRFRGNNGKYLGPPAGASNLEQSQGSPVHFGWSWRIRKVRL